jgi:hypothetical protein
MCTFNGRLAFRLVAVGAAAKLVKDGSVGYAELLHTNMTKGARLWLEFHYSL